MVLRETAALALSMTEPGLEAEQAARYADIAVGAVESILTARVAAAFATPLDEARSEGDAATVRRLAVLRDSLIRAAQDAAG